MKGFKNTLKTIVLGSSILSEVKNLKPGNNIGDNSYEKMVEQKSNFDSSYTMVKLNEENAVVTKFSKSGDGLSYDVENYSGDRKLIETMFNGSVFDVNKEGLRKISSFTLDAAKVDNTIEKVNGSDAKVVYVSPAFDTGKGGVKSRRFFMECKV